MPGIPIAVYGPSGIGKTADVARCFRKAYWFMFDPDGLASVKSLWGFTPQHYEMRNLEYPIDEFRDVMQKRVAPLAKLPDADPRKITSVVVDTGTELALRIHSVLDDKLDGQPMRVYPAVKMRFTEAIRSVLNLGLWTVVIFQEQEPRKATPKAGLTARRGGPQLPGSTTQDIMPMFSLMLRASAEIGDGKYERLYHCDLFDEQWYYKDRYQAAEVVQPMDIRPIMQRIVRKAG